MKNSILNALGLALILFVATGYSFGQEKNSRLEEKTVQGFALTKSEGTIVESTVQGVASRDQSRESIKLERHANLTFTPESTTSEARIKMTNDYNYLSVNIQSTFKAGSVTVELIDPKGEKRGNFDLKLDDMVITGNVKSQKMEVVTGQMEKEFAHPLIGEWAIRVIPVAADGYVIITFTQEFRPRIGNTVHVEGVRLAPTTGDKQKK